MFSHSRTWNHDPPPVRDLVRPTLPTAVPPRRPRCSTQSPPVLHPFAPPHPPDGPRRLVTRPGTTFRYRPSSRNPSFQLILRDQQNDPHAVLVRTPPLRVSARRVSREGTDAM